MLYTTMVVRERKREDEMARLIMEAVIPGMTWNYLRNEDIVALIKLNSDRKTPALSAAAGRRRFRAGRW